MPMGTLEEEPDREAGQRGQPPGATSGQERARAAAAALVSRGQPDEILAVEEVEEQASGAAGGAAAGAAAADEPAASAAGQRGARRGKQAGEGRTRLGTRSAQKGGDGRACGRGDQEEGLRGVSPEGSQAGGGRRWRGGCTCAAQLARPAQLSQHRACEGSRPEGLEVAGVAAITVHLGKVKATQAAGPPILFHNERACTLAVEPNVCFSLDQTSKQRKESAHGAGL